MKQILLITYDNCDDTECYYPLMRMREEGYAVTVASLEKKTIHGKHWFSAEADLLPPDIRPADYDALMLPGGTAPEKLRQNGDILCAVRAFMTAGKPVAAICHGPQLLISAGVLGGRHSTMVQTIFIRPSRSDIWSIVFIPAGKVYHANGAPACFHCDFAKRSSRATMTFSGHS